ncbi:MAG: hypothetical protein ABSG12_06830 [Steroidobacteraceae bacterium]|jgi:hypothetical protein
MREVVADFPDGIQVRGKLLADEAKRPTRQDLGGKGSMAANNPSTQCSRAHSSADIALRNSASKAFSSI